jgi:flagellar secretion chaperone FliS
MEKQKYQAYAVATQTVAKTRQIVMLYDGAIRFMQQAKEAISENRIQDRYNTLVKVNDIVMGMQGCLDFEKGGDIARILYGYYASIIDRVFTIHRDNSLQTCDDVIADLKRMRDVWNEIDQSGVTAEGSVPPPPATTTQAGDNPDTPQNFTLSA